MFAFVIGMFIEVRSGPGFKIELKRYAHRSINQLMITEMTVDNCCLDDFEVVLEMNYGNDSEDITLRSDIESGVRYFYVNPFVVYNFHGILCLCVCA